MHTFNDMSAGVPAFLAKLWRLVEDPDTNNLICWGNDGQSFIIQNQAQFARELLPQNYKHNNMASFIRQLNMYGFHKITSIENGGLKFDKDEMEFSHPYFKRNCSYLLEHIKRKIANPKNDEKTGIKPEAVTKVLQDVKAMRGRQDSLDSRFSVMKQENEALWREIASLRQKHAKQQQIVNKLIQFLITIVQPSRNMSGVKRHMQLMISDTPENVKDRKPSESGSDSGPVIHELSEELLDEVEDSGQEFINNPNSSYVRDITSNMDGESFSPLNIDRPRSNISHISQDCDFSNQSDDDLINTSILEGTVDNTGGSSIVESIKPDGSEVVYHVTEIPDSHSTEITNVNYNEDNILNTPMGQEQMARSMLLKQKNKQRRNKNLNRDSTPSTSAKAKKLQQIHQHEIPPIVIKSEINTDSNSFPDNEIITFPNLNENANVKAVSPSVINSLQNKAPNLYITNDFIPNEIPANIFEDSNENFTPEFGLGEQKRSILNGASISDPELIKNSTPSSSNINSNTEKKDSTEQNKGDNNMAITKYKSGKIDSDGNLCDDVHGHLESMQGELDSLKDLLRGEGYSLDANTLLGLFNDGDFLNSYGLSLNGDQLNDKKGSEVMTYQPYYDFSDIMDMTDKDEINASSSDAVKTSLPGGGSDSVLNTPYHE
ncbi:heat shock factor protein [Teleopsis dalmanni]|uniref:heat shock factor protein n=1 Tax=Teleopsis dalmanni TaxID=139649 RepID=UPI0018CEC647|nr:heat shock factor protein [Teleopsis dalmanni]XP_037953779.1 heat shock factor protein [Teleopsis dalmanni]